MKFNSDIDIDIGDRSVLLQHIKHIPAAIRKADEVRRHATGVYVTPIPYDPINDISAIDYREAENRGYVKLDLLNVFVYKHVRDEQHLIELMCEPNWSLLKNEEFFSKIIHIGNYYNVISSFPEPVDNIHRMAMFLSVIRPGKKHLIGKTWNEIEKEVWVASEDGYSFKRSHAYAYAHLVVVHMNLVATELA